MPFRYNVAVVLLSILIAWVASYVALDLAQRIRSHRRAPALGWGIGGSVAMGTGIWSMHFIGMLALELPVAVGYRYGPTALSWLAAVAVSAVALGLAGDTRRRLRDLAAGALAMGAGICAMHYIGMAALAFDPGIRWDTATVALSAAIAVAASAAALWLFTSLHRLTEGRTRLWRVLAAGVMASAIAGMHYTGMAAASIPGGAVCLSAGALRGDGLALLVAAASLVVLGLALFSSLVDERMQFTERELHRALLHDPLTGLPNRALLDERLRLAVQRCAADPARGAALLVIGLDGFKSLNDQFGHAFGNTVLKTLAQRLERLAAPGDTVARLDGDVFVWLLAQAADAGVARHAADRVLPALHEAVRLNDHEVHQGASIGIAMLRGDGSADRLLSSADTAMFEAKREGGGRALFFSDRMEAETYEQLALKRDLCAALDAGGTGQLALVYQPKVRAADAAVTGVEALLRWQHPERGAVGPAAFIPVAERFGLMERLGRWVVEEACRQAATWQRDGIVLRIAVNLSLHQLRSADLVPHVASTLKAHGLTGDRLLFEITESTAMTDIDASLAVLDALGALGTSLAIDDFGTGYSSLAYLQRLPLEQLKIDRSFVRDLADRRDSHAIVEAVVRMAHALGMSVVAEGVETQAQRQALRSLGCDELQGWLFAKAVPAPVITEWAAGNACPAGLHFAPRPPAPRASEPDAGAVDFVT